MNNLYYVYVLLEYTYARLCDDYSTPDVSALDSHNYSQRIAVFSTIGINT